MISPRWHNRNMALTPKEERFSQLVASGVGQSDAYRQSYDCSAAKDATIHRSAKTLMDKPKIAARIAELRAPAIAQIAINAQWVLERAVELHDLAKEQGNISAANKSLELVGKHIGVQAFKDLVEHTGTVELANRIGLARARAKGDA